jgi:hypothetical protein
LRHGLPHMDRADRALRMIPRLLQLNNRAVLLVDTLKESAKVRMTAKCAAGVNSGAVQLKTIQNHLSDLPGFNAPDQQLC